MKQPVERRARKQQDHRRAAAIPRSRDSTRFDVKIVDPCSYRWQMIS
jgi:hypothetical protein